MSVPNLEKYASDLATTVVFGLGYYLFKYLKSSPRISDKKEIIKNSLEIFINAKTIEDYIEIIQSDITLNDSIAIIDDLSFKGLNPNVDLYNALIKKYLNENDKKNSMKLVNEIIHPTSPIKANSYTFVILFERINFEITERLKEIKENQKVNHELRKQLISEIYKDFDEEINDLLKLVEKCGLNNDFKIRLKIFEFLLSQGRLLESWEFIYESHDLRNSELPFTQFLNSINITQTLNETTLNYINTSLLNVKNYQFQEETFYFIIDEYFKNNKVEQAYDFYLRVIQNQENLKSNEMFQKFVRYYSKTLKLNILFQIIEDMKTRLIDPTDEVFDLIFKACLKSKKMEKIEILIKSMKRGLNQDLIEKTITGFKMTKNFEKAINFFENNIKLFGKLFNLHSFNTVLECCVETMRIDKMHEIFENNMDNFTYDNNTFSIILRGYSKINKINDIRRTYHHIKNKGFFVDEYIYNSVIQNLIQLKEVDLISYIYDDMKSLSIKLNYSIKKELLRFYFYQQNPKGIELYDEFVKEGNLDQKIYNYGIRLLIINNNIDKAINNFRKMQLNYQNVNKDLFEIVILNCMEKKKDKESFEFSLNALKLNYRFPEELYNKLVINLLKNQTIKNQEKFDFLNRLNKEIKYRSIRLSPEINMKSEKFISSNKVAKPTLYTAGSLYKNPTELKDDSNEKSDSIEKSDTRDNSSENINSYDQQNKEYSVKPKEKTENSSYQTPRYNSLRWNSNQNVENENFYGIKSNYNSYHYTKKRGNYYQNQY